jgi:hypothetical protein
MTEKRRLAIAAPAMQQRMMTRRRLLVLWLEMPEGLSCVLAVMMVAVAGS